MKAIEISGLSKQFTGKRMAKIDALSHLDLDVAAGEIFGFLGPNGAGKSTTIKLIMGLLRPTAGSAHILGTDVSQTDSRSKVGYLPENPAFYDYLSAEEYLAFVGSQFNMGTELLRQRMKTVLKRLDLWDARQRTMRGYSKGMVQRVGLAQALLHDPEVYILDEPMSGLDPIGRALVKDIIVELKSRGKSVFFSTHITDDVEKICDRVAVLIKGKLVALDTVENVLKAGIEGYQVQLRLNGERTEFSHAQMLSESGELQELYIPLQHFTAFMSQVVKFNADIVYIEAKRTNLEDFFLSLVERNN